MFRFLTAPVRNVMAVRTMQNWSVAASAPFILGVRFNSGSSAPQETTPAPETSDSGSEIPPAPEEKPEEDTWNALHLPFCL